MKFCFRDTWTNYINSDITKMIKTIVDRTFNTEKLNITLNTHTKVKLAKYVKEKCEKKIYWYSETLKSFDNPWG